MWRKLEHNLMPGITSISTQDMNNNDTLHLYTDAAQSIGVGAKSNE